VTSHQAPSARAREALITFHHFRIRLECAPRIPQCAVDSLIPEGRKSFLQFTTFERSYAFITSLFSSAGSGSMPGPAALRAVSLTELF
jgi:hypothetical protein